MRDAQYLRAQAELCLEVARQISDLKTAENLERRRPGTTRRLPRSKRWNSRDRKEAAQPPNEAGGDVLRLESN